MTEDTISGVLSTPHANESQVVDELVPLVYDELRRMASRLLAGERQPNTLVTTGLVHEAYLKLVGYQDLPARGRGYFFGAAARAMRQVLVDAARRRGRRGGRPLTLSRVDPAAAEPEAQVLARLASRPELREKLRAYHQKMSEQVMNEVIG